MLEIPPMASSPTIVVLVFLYSLVSGADSKCLGKTCAPGEPYVQFPFRLKDFQDEKCGYTGFDLSCNNQNRTILTLPALGDFRVYNIDYVDEIVTLQDPSRCLARRLFAGFVLNGSAFFGENYWNITFFNCSSSYPVIFPSNFQRAWCLETSNYHIYVGPSDGLMPVDQYRISTCHDNWTVSIPVESKSWPVITEYLPLKWNGTAFCKYCREHAGFCRASFRGNKSTHCTSKNELSRAARIGIILGVASPWFLCMLGVSCYISNANRGESDGNMPLPPHSTDRQTQLVGMGMDGAAIELYPKSQVGDSWQLPRPSDNTCSICLSEYKPKETLRLIPECSHYFHAHCIDPWLMRNGSCPLCRNRLE